MLIMLPNPSFRGVYAMAQRHFPGMPAIFVTDDNTQYGYARELDRFHTRDFVPQQGVLYRVVANNQSISEMRGVLSKLLTDGATFQMITLWEDRVQPGLMTWQVSQLGDICQ
jgi:hypothetical protein